MLKSDTYTSTQLTPSFRALPVVLAMAILSASPIPAMGDDVVDAGLAQETAPPEQRGIALGLFKQEPEWSYIEFITEIKQAGATHVALVVSNYLKTDSSNEIYFLPNYTAPHSTIIRTIKEIRDADMEVFLFPILRVEDKSNGGWRGTLHPGNPDLFYKNYTRYIVDYAKLAEDQNVPLFSVGSELSTLDIQTDRWVDIIENVRQVYSGKVTYSANWDNYNNIKFIDRLDFAGVTGYFALENAEPPFTENPSVETLVHSWREVYFQLLRWQARIGKPLLFTEVGYLSQKGAAAQPWAEGANQPVDLEIQRRCYEAFIRVWDGEERLAGSYFWNWFDWEGENDMEYTPRNKPASAELSKWYKNAANEDSSAPAPGKP